MRSRFSVPLLSALTLAFVAAGAAVLPATAQSGDPIAERQAIMKDNGRQSRTLNQMVKGEAPFDAAVALAAFQEMNKGAERFGELFPEGTETGGDTEAAPAIWTNRAEFQEHVDKFAADTAAAVAAAPQDVAALSEQFRTVSGNCRSCHEEFRVDN
jgi:cytochrome c556